MPGAVHIKDQELKAPQQEYGDLAHTLTLYFLGIHHPLQVSAVKLKQ